MPRIKNGTCSHCAKPMDLTPSSAPPDRIICHDCSRLRRASVACVVCGGTFAVQKLSGKLTRKTCSPACRTKSFRSTLATPRPCQDCGGATTRHPNGAGPVCDACRAERRRAHYRRKNTVRRGAVAVGPTLSIEQLGRRDGWRCHLCRRPVNATLKAPHRRSPTFDHLIPVSAGGDDSPTNLRLAHFGCNSSRGNRGSVQLILFG